MTRKVVFAAMIAISFPSLLRWQAAAQSAPLEHHSVAVLRNCIYEHARTTDAGEVSKSEVSHSRCFDEDLGNGVKLTMIEIPEGDFLMGSPVGEQGRKTDEGPQHRVHVKRFFIGQFEVTTEQWEQVRSSLPPVKGKMYEPLTSIVARTHKGLPADGIRFAWAEEFCARLSRLTGKHYRLPTEAEWEYAARAGTVDAYAYGQTITSKMVNWRREDNGVQVFDYRAVGTSGPANAFGLYDIHGSSAEWVSDRYHLDYIGAPTDGSAWLSPDKRLPHEVRKDRIQRGGSSSMKLELLRCAARYAWGEQSWPTGTGMRVAMMAGEDAPPH